MDQLSNVINELLGTSGENQLAEMMLKIAGKYPNIIQNSYIRSILDNR